jgi:DNA helicase-2/ATP-dependent DNA helicase PcrA
MEAKELLHWAQRFDETTGTHRAVIAIDFAKQCITQVSTALATIHNHLDKGAFDFGNLRKHLDIAQTLTRVGDDDPASLLDAFQQFERLGVLYRVDLWYSMKSSVKAYMSGEFATLQDAAWYVRDQMRLTGRKLGQRLISRTVLVKGLEFDHAIILDADKLDMNNLYVAMTRGAKSLTILSQSPVISR